MPLLAWIYKLASWVLGHLGLVDSDGDSHSSRRDDDFVPLFVTRLEERRVLSTITVTGTGDDVVDGDGEVTLREAIIAANTDASVDGSTAGSGNDTIIFDGSLAGQTITLGGTQLPNITGTNGNLNITGLGADQLTISGNNLSRVLQVDVGATFEIEGVTITGGSVTGTEDGAGILNRGTLTVTASTITFNTAAGDNSAGGGIENDLDATLTITSSTISNNVANDGGGGIANNGNLTVINSTISGNTNPDDGVGEPGSDTGGGIGNFDDGTVTIINSTISNNSAAFADGGLSVDELAVVTNVSNTIIAGNTTAGSGPDVGGAFTSGGNNLIGDVGAATGLSDGINDDQVGGGGNPVLDPQLGPLQDNGGPTFTHALLTGSPAIDAGSNTLAVDSTGNPLSTDQRGFGRILDGGNGTLVDIGAFELRRVIVGQNFTGGQLFLNGNLSIPPDTMGSVSPNHIVELINGRFAIYNKTNGNLIQTTSLDQFWIDAGLAGTSGTFDPRVIYDHASQRWFVTSIDGSGGNSIFVAVSTTSDPTAGWTGFSFVGDSINGTRFNDFDSLGLDADGVYIATNNFIEGSFSDVSIYSIPKADLLAATPTIANLSRFENQNVNNLGFGIQPAVDFGPSDGRAAMIADFNGAFGVIRRSDILDGGTAAASLNFGPSITVPTFAQAPLGRQPGANDDIETGGTRFSGNVVELGDRLWAVHTVLDPVTGNAATRWYEISETTNALLQSGTISDPNLDYYFPSIAVNQFGDVVIGMSGSGDSQFISTYAAVGQTVDGVTTFAAPQLLMAGVAEYSQVGPDTRNRWGAYSATVVDPSDPTTFWTFQEFAIATDTWAVQVTQLTLPQGALFDFGDAPETGTNYPTTLANNGARHAVVTGVSLGTTIDSEADGQPNANATADGSDEDGVTFDTSLVSGLVSNLTVNASTAGFLNAWVDFNDDGDWADAGEQIFTDQSLASGNNALQFFVPLDAAVTSQTFARFRFTTADSNGTLSFDGAANDGEVEDYQVAVGNGSGATLNVSTNTLFVVGDRSDPAADTYDVRQNGADLEVRINSVLAGTFSAADVNTITINGSDDDDTLIVNFMGGSPIPAGSIAFDGGGQSTGGDSLEVTGGNATTVTHIFTNENDGSLNIDGSLITYTGLEPITDNLVAVNRVFTFSGGMDDITLSDDAGTAGNSFIDSNLSESVSFANPSNSLIINAGGGNDVIDVQGLDSAFDASITINGDADTDTVTFSGATAPGGGNITVAAENVNVNQTITLTNGSFMSTGTTFNSTGGTINSASGNVTIDHAGTVDLPAINLTAGNLNVTAAGAVTQDSVLIIGGTTSITAGTANNITLDNPGNDFGGAVTVVSANNVDLNDNNAVDLGDADISGTYSVTANEIDIGGDVTANAVDFDASSGTGSITDTSGTLTVTTTTTLRGQTTDNITLDGANDFQGAVGVTQGNNVTLNDANDLTLATLTTQGFLTAIAGGALATTANMDINSGGNVILQLAADQVLTVDPDTSITAANNVTLIADQMTLQSTGGDLIHADGTLQLRAAENGTILRIGAAAGADAVDTLALDGTDIDALDPASGAIVFGAAASRGATTIANSGMMLSSTAAAISVFSTTLEFAAAGDAIELSQPNATFSIDATGSISSAPGGGNDIIVSNLNIVQSGALGTALDPVRISVDKLTAQSVNGDAFVTEVDGIELGDVNVAVSSDATLLVLAGNITQTAATSVTADTISLTAEGGNIGAAGDAIDVTARTALNVTATGSDVFLTSSVDLVVNSITTAAETADTVQITTTGAANLTLTGTGGYTDVDTDTFDLNTGTGTLTIQDNALSVSEFDIDALGGDVTFTVATSARTGFNVNTVGGNFDAGTTTISGAAAGLDVTIDTSNTAGVDAGNVSLGLLDDTAGSFVNNLTAILTGGSGTNGRLTLNEDILLINVAGDTGDFTVNNTRAVVISDNSPGTRLLIDTERGGVGAGGTVDFGTADISTDVAGTDLTIVSSGRLGNDTGSIIFGSVNNTVGGQFINELTLRASGPGGGGIMVSGGEIRTDSVGSQLSLVAIDGNVLLTQSLLIDSLQNATDSAGPVSMNFTTFSATLAGADLAIDTSTAAAGPNAGNIELGVFNDTAGSFVNDITLTLTSGAGGNDGTALLFQSISLDANGSDTGDLTITTNNNIIVGRNITIETENGSGRGGNVLFAAAANVVSGAAVGTFWLSIEVGDAVVGGGNDGNVSLGRVGQAGGNVLGGLFVTADTGTITLNGDITTLAGVNGNTGDVLFGSATVLTGDRTVTTTGGNFDGGNTFITSDAAGPHSLTINTSSGIAAAGTVTIGGVGDADGGSATNSGISTLTISANGTSDGDVNIEGTIETTGQIQISNAAAVNVDADVTAGGALDIFNIIGSVDLATGVNLTGSRIDIDTNIGDIDLDGAGTNVITTTQAAGGDLNLAAVNDSGGASNLQLVTRGGLTLAAVTIFGTLDIDLTAAGGASATLNAAGAIQAGTIDVVGADGDDTFNFTSTVTSTVGGITIDNAQLVNIDGTMTSAAAITVMNATRVDLGANLQTDGGIVDFSTGSNDIDLFANVTIDTNSDGAGNSGSVMFGSGSDIEVEGGSAAGIFTLTIDVSDNAAGGGNDGDVTLGAIGQNRAIGELSVTADTGTITLSGDITTLAGVNGNTGDITFGSFIQLAANRAIDTGGGNANFQSTDFFSSPTGPFDLDINSDGGDVRLRDFTNTDGVVAGTFVNNVTVDTGGGFLELNGTINLDFDAVSDMEAASFVVDGRVTNIDVRVAENARIDTEQGDNQVGGDINLGSGNVSGSAGNRTLTLDARGDGSGGEISLGPVTNIGGGSFLAGFSGATEGVGKTNLDNDVTIDNPGNVTSAVTAGVTFNGRVEVLGSQQIVTQRDNNNNAGFVDLQNAILFAQTADDDLTINTSVSGADNAGDVNLGVFSDDGGLANLVENLMIDSSGGATNGNVTVSQAVQTAGNLTVTNAELFDQNATITTGGNLTVSAASNIDLNNVNTTNLSLTTNGVGASITQSAATMVTATGTSLLRTVINSDITLNNATNDFGGAVTLTGGNNVTLQDVNSLALAAVTANQSLTAMAGTSLIVNGIINVPGAGGVSLTAARNIVMNAGSAITTIGGDVTLTANLDGTAVGNFVGISLTNADITTGMGAANAGGDISLNGQGGDTGSINIGVQIAMGSTIASTGLDSGGPTAGTITIIGSGGAGDDFNVGVLIGFGNTQVTSVDGDIAITGSGGSNGIAGSNSNRGVEISFGAVVSSTGMDVAGRTAALITINGTGGAGEDFNDGVSITNANTQVTSVDGDIAITGSGGSNGMAGSNSNRGVDIDNGALVSSTGTGAAAALVNVTGTGANGDSSNKGVLLSDIGMQVSQVASIDGDVSIVGIGGATAVGTRNEGVEITSLARINITGSADVIVNGTAGANTAEGVLISGGAVVGDNNFGNDATGFIILDANAGELEINASTVRTNAPANATRRILLSADSIELVNSLVQINSLGAGASLGQGEIVAAPNDGTVNINLGAGADAGGAFDLDDVELNQFDARIVRIGSAHILAPGNTPTITNQNGNTIIDATQMNLARPYATGTQSTITVTGAFTPQAAFATDLFQLRTRDTTNAAVTDSIAINGSLNLQTNNRGRHFEAYAGLDVTQGNSADVTTQPAAGPDDNALVEIAVRDGDVHYRAERLINMTAGTSITTIDGEITLSANQQGLPTTGDFSGIDLNNAAITTGVAGTNPGGDITLTGRSGDAGSGNAGVQVRNGATIESTGDDPGAGTITVTGTGLGGVDDSDGVRIDGAGTMVTSISGIILLDGTGSGTLNDNNGVQISNAALVESTGIDSGNSNAATITIVGVGSTAGARRNDGVRMSGTDATVRSIDGDILLMGIANGTASNNRGVFIVNGAIVRSTGIDDVTTARTAATITIDGTSNGATTNNEGVKVDGGVGGVGGANALVTSVDGDILIEGRSNGAGEDNEGVEIGEGAVISSTGRDINGRTAATITIRGTGHGTDSNEGIQIEQEGTLITSIDGDITLFGTTNSTGDGNEGVEIQERAVISSTGTGPNAATITIDGVGSGFDDSEGVLITDMDTRVHSVDGNIMIIGTSASTGMLNAGVEISDEARIAANGAATITINGTGSGANPGGAAMAENNSGVQIDNAAVESTGGAINITGTGSAAGMGTGNDGVELRNGGVVESLGAGAVNIAGVAGSGSGANIGISIENVGTRVQSGDGAIVMNGQSTLSAGNGNTGIGMTGGSTVASTANGAVQFTGTGSAAASNNRGVFITGAGTEVTAAGGVTITGTGGSNGMAGSDDNEGVRFSSGAVVTSNGNGALNVTGIAGSGEDNNRGVFITGAGTEVTAAGGVTITGTGGSNGMAGSDNNEGVRFSSGAVVTSNGNGALNVTGIAGSGEDNNRGVFITGASRVTGSAGGVTITGTGGSNGMAGSDNNEGVRIDLGSTVMTTAAGAVNITGTGTNMGDGVNVDASVVRSTQGDIQIIGSTEAVGANNEGIHLRSGARVQADGDGNISLTGTDTNAASADHGVLIDGTLTIITSNTGAIHVTGIDPAGVGGNVQMNNGSQLRSTTGEIQLTSTNDVQLGRVTTGGNVVVIADSDNAGSGAVIDNLTGDGMANRNIIADMTALNGATGIGSGDPLDTGVVTIAALNSTLNNVEIVNDTGGRLLTIGTVGGVVGVVNHAPGGDINITNNGPLTVGAPVLNTGGGNINLTSAGDLVVDKQVSATGGNGSITLDAGSGVIRINDDPNSDDELLVEGTGAIVGMPQNTAIVAPGVFFRSGTGRVSSNVPNMVISGNSSIDIPDCTNTGIVEVGFDFGRPGELNFGLFVEFGVLAADGSFVLARSVVARSDQVGVDPSTRFLPTGRGFSLSDQVGVDPSTGFLPTGRGFSLSETIIRLPPGRAGFDNTDKPFLDGNPNPLKPQAAVFIRITVINDPNISIGFDAVIVVVSAAIPGEGIGAVSIDTGGQVRELTFPEDDDTPFVGNPVTPVSLASQTERIIQAIVEASLTTSRRIIVHPLTPTGERVTVVDENSNRRLDTNGEPRSNDFVEIELDENVLDDLPKLFERLPDGRYRIYLKEAGEERLRLLLEIDLRSGIPTRVKKDDPDSDDSQNRHKKQGTGQDNKTGEEKDQQRKQDGGDQPPNGAAAGSANGQKTNGQEISILRPRQSSFADETGECRERARQWEDWGRRPILSETRNVLSHVPNANSKRNGQPDVLKSAESAGDTHVPNRFTQSLMAGALLAGGRLASSAMSKRRQQQIDTVMETVDDDTFSRAQRLCRHLWNV